MTASRSGNAPSSMRRSRAGGNPDARSGASGQAIAHPQIVTLAHDARVSPAPAYETFSVIPPSTTSSMPVT